MKRYRNITGDVIFGNLIAQIPFINKEATWWNLHFFDAFHDEWLICLKHVPSDILAAINIFEEVVQY